ncbi:MAG TPA: hypothetical protein PKY87_16005 [Terricaulis sp.]|nr:hypothetical protein [Terricaulis sp.]
MRAMFRSAGAAAFVLGMLALAACEREAPVTPEAPGAPTNAEREAEIAAQQLAALGGNANAEQRALYQGDFQASGGIDATGSEGAWELRLLDDYAQFSRPGLGEDGGVAGARDFRAGGMRVVAGPLTITLRREACSASGIELEYVAHVLFEGVAYQGCARRGVNEGPRSTWASVLPELIPAIDSCIARASARPARVTFATAMDDAVVAVRVREADGARRECIAPVGGGEVTVYETLSDVDRRPGEGDPEFQRGGGQPRACAEAVSGRDGVSLGWLIPRDC